MSYDIKAKIDEFWSFKDLGICKIQKIGIDRLGIWYEVLSLSNEKTTKVYQECLRNKYKLEMEILTNE